MTAPRRLLTIGHSYVVALNRRLAHEMARTGSGRWDVTAVAPRFMAGDLRPILLEPAPGEACRLEPVPAYLTRRVHLMAYGRRLKALLSGPWDLVHVWEEPYVFAGFQACRWARSGVPVVFWTAQNLRKRYPPPFAWFERTEPALVSIIIRWPSLLIAGTAFTNFSPCGTMVMLFSASSSSSAWMASVRVNGP